MAGGAATSPLMGARPGARGISRGISRCPSTHTPHYPLQLPLTPPGSSQPIPHPEIPLEIPLAPGLVPMRGEVAAPPAIGPPRDKPEGPHSCPLHRRTRWAVTHTYPSCPHPLCLLAKPGRLRSGDSYSCGVVTFVLFVSCVREAIDN